MEVDYDTDESGIYRAKSSRPETEGARAILDSSTTKVDLPVDLLPAEEVTDEVKWKNVYRFFMEKKLGWFIVIDLLTYWTSTSVPPNQLLVKTLC